MITVQINGGLGNQLFQYAAARSLAEKHDGAVCIDTHRYEQTKCSRPFDLDKLKISAEYVTTKPSLNLFSSRYKEKSYGFNQEVLNLPDDSYLEGCFESDLYFKDIEKIIHEEFLPREFGTLDRAQQLIHSVRHLDKQVVSIHVRRGDFLKAFPKNVIEAEQIKSAISWFKDCVFIVFSDEIGWCKSNLQDKSIFFSTGENNIEDLFAMSMCDHHIISHSSFGWWGAWLNKHPTKTVLMPSRHFLSNATYDTIETPAGWILSKM